MESYIITTQNIKDYHTKPHKRHRYYAESVKLYETINTHFTGRFPGDIIKAARPGETEAIRKFREAYFVPNTKPTVMRVFNALQKIRKSPDWIIQFDSSKVPSTIINEEGPECYFMDDYPEYDSITNWSFSIQLMQMLIDANAFVLVMPKSFEVQENEYIEPIPIIFNAPNVIDYVIDQFYIFKSNESHYYGRNSIEGSIYYGVTNTTITKFIQVDGNGNFAQEWIYEHRGEDIPVVMMRGIVTDYTKDSLLAESRIQSMVPFLQEAIREYSDLVGLKLYQIPKMWIYKQQPCKGCNGSSMIKNSEGVKIKCSTCMGKGVAPMNPFDILEITPPTADELPLSGDPIGFITPPVEALRFMADGVEAHIYNALSAINMQDMADVPAVNSGIAKSIDREDQNSWIHSVAEDLVRVLDAVCDYTIVQRYGMVLNYDYSKLKQLEPTINVPDKYDLISAQSMMDDLEKLKTSGASAAIFNAAQIDLATKLFPTNKEIKRKYEMIVSLDPLSGSTPDEILSAAQSGWITDSTATLHFNINEYLERAIDENKDFFDMMRSEQVAILTAMADEELNMAQDKALKASQTFQQQQLGG